LCQTKGVRREEGEVLTRKTHVEDKAFGGAPASVRRTLAKKTSAPVCIQCKKKKKERGRALKKRKRASS